MRREAGDSLKIVALALAIALLACGSETRTVHFDFQPLPFPIKPVLTFSGPEPGASAQAALLLADGLIDATNNAWMLGNGFDTTVFDFPNWKGRKVILERPETAASSAPPEPSQLAESPAGMVVTWPEAGVATVLEGTTWRQIPLPSLRTRLARNGDLLVPDANRGWQRLGHDGKLKGRYATTAESQCVSGDSNGSFAALSREALLECFDANGQKSLQIALPKHDQKAELNYRDLLLRHDRLYILYGRGERSTSYLLVLDLKGTVRNHWTLPLASDGIDCNGLLLMLYDTSSTQAYLFPLES